MKSVHGWLGTPRLFANRRVEALYFWPPEVFDPMIARTFILPFREDRDDEGVHFAEDTILINFGEDVDRNLVCVTTNRIEPQTASILFPKTSIGMANLVTMLINSAYSAMTPEEWLGFLVEADADS